MIIRCMTNNEISNYKWKTYPLDITTKTTKEDIIKHLRKGFIETNELDQGIPIYINPITTDIIIIFKNNIKSWGRYNHIYKGDCIQIIYNDKIYAWSKIKNKIRKIIFMDNIWLHETLKDLWGNNGFKFDIERIRKTKNIIFNSI